MCIDFPKVLFDIIQTQSGVDVVRNICQTAGRSLEERCALRRERGDQIRGNQNLTI